MKFPTQDWPAISALLDEALELPPEHRDRWLDALPEAARVHRDTLSQLLADHAHVETQDFLHTLPKLGEEAADPSATVGVERSIGPYRLLRVLGRGGMGTVWLAERSDGQLKRCVALKLPHVGLPDARLVERFARERDILASLAHPHIARLYDAGVADEGQPFLALEYVEGEPFAKYCDAHQLGLTQRIRLFLQVLAAVQYAHAHLVVHRDIKPSNVMVTSDGQVRLLDFGIAKLMIDGVAKETELTQLGGRALTLDYASPEQIGGQAITTASDLYSLGVLLYELLAGERPYRLKRDTRAALEEAILAADVLKPSEVVFTAATAQARSTSTRRLKRDLAGDLDTIILKALKKNPAARYGTADAFAQDIERHLKDEAILARPDSPWYQARKFLWRNKGVTMSATTVLIALALGLGVALQQTSIARHQAEVAGQEAQREKITKDFLLSVFRASDPRIASDKPRGTITAKELLDISSTRIEREFAKDPDTEIQLLGIVADIYGELDENETFVRLIERQTDLARKQYGNYHPIVINGLLKTADDANTRGDTEQALKLLGQSDDLIKRAGLDRAAERAYWWLIRGFSVHDASSNQKRLRAFEHAVDLYATVAPDDLRHAFALSALGGIYHAQGDYVRAAEYTKQSIAIAEKVPDRDDGALSANYSNLGKSLAFRGDFDGAERANAVAVSLAKSTYGVNSWYYWIAAANQAQAVHLRGDRERSQGMFEALLPLLPDPSTKYRNALEENSAAQVFETYGSRLSAEGRARAAIPWLAHAERGYIEAPFRPSDIDHVRGELGSAYDQAGKAEDAERLLKTALDGYLSTSPIDEPRVLQQRERWGRFLLKHGDVSGSGAQFREILAQAHERNLFSVALAHGGLALIAVQQHDGATALQSSARALDIFDNVTGFRDVRMGPYLWRIRAEALLESGDARGAVEWARRALDSVRRYDDAASPDLAIAETTFRSAVRASSFP